MNINKKLLPLSWFYGIGVGFRNFLFETNILKSRSFSTPVISVGNITVGGTGKTPHVEYLVRLLKDKAHVAVLSRGYKRKSSGFLLATPETTMKDIGDEPYQMKQKFPDIDVAVDKKRTRGIDRLIKTRDVDVILLDDAFQHRYVKPGINILLVDHHRLIIYDELLPAGRLRESVDGKNRADIVIVTKCPKTLNPMEFRVLTKQMNLYPYQQLYFTTIDYDPLLPVFESKPSKHLKTLEDLAGNNILLLTGIASPGQMKADLKPYAASLRPLTFSDHHYFKAKDVRRINEIFSNMPSPKLIVTTEKDATRLKAVNGFSEEVRNSLYALPIKVSFMQDGEEQFDERILGYIQKNSRNSILVKGKKDKKPKDNKDSEDKPRTIIFK